MQDENSSTKLVDAKGEDEVVATHEALGVVAQWLGMSMESVLTEVGPSELDTSTTKRPHFLGLGAKFVTHKKAAPYAAIDSRLKQRLNRGRHHGDSQEESSPVGTSSSTVLLHTSGQHRAAMANVGRRYADALNQMQRDGPDNHQSSEDEEEGKATFFKKRKEVSEEEGNVLPCFYGAPSSEMKEKNRRKDPELNYCAATVLSGRTAKEQQQFLLVHPEASINGNHKCKKKKK
ncbi:hypothetical protein CEUSTIGMA_g6577.t1 [Chlamydomonas eustigma]|uniref:Uncharacterized protein n=1 Tax=Chlamydomonas eustigma TaxID=1157962 RepID=A0A250X7U2_9CHLO|nr:hypothetical protein CEUSTIGMA_g6577.t1 [Chlamydomonas eustigma]|eukprot:GAX79137.1 hypothetical protein CEUSTIGMA_g6577.t1 [Chlamydomonas eustigma]